MVAIGRALMSNPSLLLCDEISLGLAPIIVREIYARLPDIRREGSSLIIVEQDIAQALSAATRVYCMQEGRMVLNGAARRTQLRRDLGGLFRSVVVGLGKHHPARRAGRRPLRDVCRRAFAHLRRDAARQHRARRPDRARGLSGAGHDRDAWRKSVHIAYRRRPADGRDRLRVAARIVEPDAE